jgi:hypothetical protein
LLATFGQFFRWLRRPSSRKPSQEPSLVSVLYLRLIVAICGIVAIFAWTGAMDSESLRGWLLQVRELRSAGLIGEFEQMRVSRDVALFARAEGAGEGLLGALFTKKPGVASGEIGILNALEYSDLLAANDSGADSKLLYHSPRTGEYLVFFAAGRTPKSEIFRIARQEGRVVPDSDVSLQSLSGFALNRRQLRSIERDPREGLQWYAEDWQDSPAQRFPLSLDQKYPELQLERQGEIGFWLSSDIFSAMEMSGMTQPLLRSRVGRGCENHEPLTSRTAWIQNWYMDRVLQRKKFPSLMFSLSDQSEVAVESLDSALILHDTIPDLNHPELAGLVFRADELGFAQRRGVTGGHGTHGAGVVAAARNQMGGSGIAPGAKIIAFGLGNQYGEDVHSGGSSKLHLRDVIPGLSDIKKYLDARASFRSGEKSARVILLGYAAEVEQLSHARPLNLVLEDILYEHDVLVVAPSGNWVTARNSARRYFVPSDSALNFNAGRSRGFVLPVASSDVCSRPAWFTHVAEALPGRSFFAPGQGIYSTFPNSDYGFLTGTSSSAAVAAGIALALSDGFGIQAKQKLAASTWGRSESGEGLSIARSLAGIMVSTSKIMQHNNRNYMIDSLKIVETIEGIATSETSRTLGDEVRAMHSTGRIPLNPQ